MDSFFSLFEPINGNANQPHQVPNIDQENIALPPEPQLGNIEYKLKIVNPSKQRFEHLVTQLKWRLREGNGEAIYEIGVQDSGALTGLSRNDMAASLQTLAQMASKLGATTSIIKERTLDNSKHVAEILIRKIPEEHTNQEIRIGVLGNADAGKSTLLGVLTQGNLDNGRGKARLNMFRHLHEIQTGRTSSISHEILGFNANGQPINYSTSELITAEEICKSSAKIINFLDLAGHRKYLRTTIQGLSGYSPHLAMLVISCTAGPIGTASEHLSISVALNLPFFIVLTKIDLVEPWITMERLRTFLKDGGSDKKPVIIHTDQEAIAAGRKYATDDIVPVFCVSSVNGAGLGSLTKFLFVLEAAGYPWYNSQLEKKSAEFRIDENFKAGELGQVLGGLLVKGIITEGSLMRIGPSAHGTFQDVSVKSIHKNRVPCRIVRAGQTAALCLDTYIPSLRNGMVLVSRERTFQGSLFFEAKICLQFQAAAIFHGFQTTAYIGNVRQTVIIIGIFSSECIQSNKRESVLLKFKNKPEYITAGQRLLLRDGSTKGVGEVTQTFPLRPIPPYF